MTKKNTRLAGHELASEGAAYYREARTERIRRAYAQGTSGAGFGLCSCGEISQWLDSGNARKQWHNEHKNQMRAALKL